VKVVILGQDPYHGPNQAHGLCFSVPNSVKPPPSLVNIFKELQSDIGKIINPGNGNLEHWAEQGVFLLNTTLTVEQSKPLSHQNYGWGEFTDKVISVIDNHLENIVFILWGAFAQSKKNLIDSKKHLILTAPHPSPLSAHRGFFGSKPFSQTNTFLQSKQIDKIKW
jgi:uracil-DNA glycosylase